MVTGGKRTVLFLKHKIKLIEAVESVKKPKNAVADLRISPKTVSVIVKLKDGYKQVLQ